MYLFTCLLNAPKANYKVKTVKQQKLPSTKQGNLHHLDNTKNSVSAITPTIMR
jgi:hypothetical protein